MHAIRFSHPCVYHNAVLAPWLYLSCFQNTFHTEMKIVNPLTPNDPYSGRTAPLNSKRCILYIYSTNIGTEYFKRGIYSAFFLFEMQFVS